MELSSLASSLGRPGKPTPTQTVRIARAKKYSPAQLAALFPDMPLNIAADLLRYRIDLDRDGRVIPCK